MQRSLNARAQAELVEAFVTSCGGKSQHTAVLELIARLNGAANWNALERPARDTGFIKKVRHLLSPWAQRFGLEKELASFRPDPRPAKTAQVVMQALFQVTVACQHEQPRTSWKLAAGLLEELSQAAQELRHQVLRQAGHNRMVARPEGSGFTEYALQTFMLDEEKPWQIELNGELFDLEYEHLQLVLDAGVVIHAVVEYPRADHYGVPEMATVSGTRDWLWEQGFALANNAYFSAEDRGDDGIEECKATVLLPDDVGQRLRKALIA